MKKCRKYKAYLGARLEIKGAWVEAKRGRGSNYTP